MRPRLTLPATALGVALALGSAHAAPAPAPIAAATASPSAASKAAEREALKATLLQVLERQPLKQSHVSIHLQSLDDGSVVFSQNADDLLNPASNVKLVTAAAALVTLGPEYRFDTEFLVEPELSGGRAKTLYVRGKGDPSMTTERLYGVVGELVHAGLREVGDIVLDDTWFDAERTAPGYDQEDTDRAYMAPTGALSLNANTVGIYLRPAEAPGQKASVEVEPASEFFLVEGGLATGSRRARRISVSSEAAGDKQKLVVRGVLPADKSGAVSVWKKVDNPPMYFGYTLKSLLAQRGVKVKGKVKLGGVSANARLLHVSQSETFDLVLKRLNKHSSNFVAETLVKTMGAEVHGAPGSFMKGIDVVEGFLERDVGIPRGSYVMKNGSGLNDTNRFSSSQLDRILRHMWVRFPLAPEYLSSLGIAGKDGTLKYRFEGSDAVGRLRAKTGTLANVSALSGYVQAAGGERFTFSMMVNDFPGRTGAVVQGLDALGAAVAAAGSASGPQRAVAQLTPGAGDVSPLAQVKGHIVTYLAMSKQRDPRNLGFLRTAWRSEKDPAVRAVVAEALYQSSSSDYQGVRALLDSFSAGDEVYGRLRAVARELNVEVPGVGSVMELAAGGNAEALTRAVELSRAANKDAQAQGELATSLAEVARTAPHELLGTLKGAAEADRTAAVALLAQGLVRSDDADHPFWRALRQSQGAQDAELATFARNLDGSLSQAVAQAKAPAAGGSTVTVSATAGAVPVLTPDLKGFLNALPQTTAVDRPGG
nr:MULTISPECIES: D-alanyl-D-alanine carboxypeptidase/D-alanyl-D-alanine-endopeptidase [Myxococcaceae]